MTIVPEGRITATAPFTIAVHMKNTGAKLPHQPWLQLGTQMKGESVSTGDDYSLDEILAPGDDGTDGYRDDKPFKHGQELVKRYRVTPKAAHERVTFIAEATAWDSAPGPVIGGAMDVKTFDVVDTTHEVAAK
jgi:hypothetical protein